MKITFGILAVCACFALAACNPSGMASSPNTCLKDGSVSWWVNPNKEGKAVDTATMDNCAVANTAWKKQ